MATVTPPRTEHLLREARRAYRADRRDDAARARVVAVEHAADGTFPTARDADGATWRAFVAGTCDPGCYVCADPDDAGSAAPLLIAGSAVTALVVACGPVVLRAVTALQEVAVALGATP